MANLTRTDWPLGWVPSSDAVNGDPAGLLRMDNLQRDEFGALTLVRGIQRLSQNGSFNNYVDQLYSKLIGNQEIIWASLGPSGQSIIRSGSGSFGGDSSTVNGNDRTSFGDALGSVLILSGTSRIKDSGSAQQNLGLATPGAPTVNITNDVGGVLNGSYNYVQVNINNNGFYVATSPVSNPAGPVAFINGTAAITAAPGDSQTTACRIYRRSFFIQGETPTLSQYYLVGEVAPGGTLNDNFPDVYLLQVDQTVNPFLKTLLAGDPNGIPEPIYGVEGLFYGRMLYMTLSYIYISDFLNPDAVDSRWTLKAFGDPTEKNLWIKKLTNNVIILGTSKNLYEITGTLALLPDGTIDIQLNPIGEAHPPLTLDCCATSGKIFYMGADGVRVTAGSNSELISPQLRSLFQGQNCHGIAPVVISQYARYAMAIGKTRLYITLPLTDGTRWLLIFDLISKTWRIQYTDPVSLNVTQSDRVLVGYNTPGSNFSMGQLFEIDEGAGFNTSDGTLLDGQKMYFLTVYDHNGQPRNRKDTFTLKIVANTGGGDVDVYVGIDGGDLAFLKTINSGGQQTHFISMKEKSLGFRYAVKLVDKGTLSFFKLFELTLEYDARPEQLNYLRIPNNNLGSISRKRVVDYAFIIDTLGEDVTFTPFIDNSNDDISPASGVVNHDAKQTFIHYFEQEQIGTDFGGTLESVDPLNPFEFYGLNTEEIVSEKMPVPAKFLVIPANNYGTPNRKRHSSYKFQINTNGHPVTFTPILDGIEYAPVTFNTPRKQTVEYFFPLADGDVIGIDIGGTLSGNDPFEFYNVEVPQDVEALPPRLKYFKIPFTNLGTYSRKRITAYAFIIDTGGEDVTFTPLLEGSNSGVLPASSVVNTQGRTTFIHYFTQEEIATDIGGYLEGNSPFEFYGVDLQETVSEKCPTPCKFLVIPQNNYGTPNRKRHSSYKFIINTRGHDVLFTPRLDGVNHPAQTYNTTEKVVVEYFFTSDTISIDIGGTLRSDGPFEFYGPIIPQEVEQLPARLEFYKIPNNNLGSISRKRFVNYAFVIDTYGHDVVFTPLIDNSNNNIVPSNSVVNYSGKQTFIHYFTQEQLGTDIGGTLSGSYPFECYGIDPSKIVSEDLPTPVKYLVIPNNDYGTPNRKRHTSYKFQIDTRGRNVKFTPHLDNVAYDTLIFSTNTKTTVDYFFDTQKGDIIGIDIGGILESIEDTPFEFYHVIVPQEVEPLPARLEFFRIPNNNLGIAAKKRVRTIPLVIDTRGRTVVFTPIVDGQVIGPSSNHVTNGKITSYHYFQYDSFGTDYGGQLVCNEGNFEFYGLGTNEKVETLPVPKEYDQIGPIRLDKIGKLFNFRIRLIATNGLASIPFSILGAGDGVHPQYSSSLYDGAISVVSGTDEIYQVDLPKSVNSSMFRLVLGPTAQPFHRFELLLRVSTSGMETDAKWIPMR